MGAMSMTSLVSSFIFSIKEILIAFLLILLLSPNSYSLNPNKHDTLDSTKDALVEEKSRLGSMPPSCYNKCNQCHPCRAVQVPSLPNHNRVESSGDSTRTQPMSMDYIPKFSPAEGSRYSNYKPLGWKCRCGGHFYNP